MHTVKQLTSCAFAAFIHATLLTGCMAEPEDTETSVTDEAAGELTIAIGLHGCKSCVSSSAVVDENLAKNLSDNPNHTFWWFCGQSATATAINFARGTPSSTLTNTYKTSQIQWIHDRLKFRQTASEYSASGSPGPYAAKIDWLYNLMIAEKSTEFTTTVISSYDREQIKYNMIQALDNGAYVVALNRTSNTGAGHYLTVHAIDYQPTVSGGGKVYYGDVLLNILDNVDFSVFLDRMLSQSTIKLYNAFTVKKK